MLIYAIYEITAPPQLIDLFSLSTKVPHKSTLNFVISIFPLYFLYFLLKIVLKGT
jgi:hypothetical protein